MRLMSMMLCQSVGGSDRCRGNTGRYRRCSPALRACRATPGPHRARRQVPSRAISETCTPTRSPIAVAAAPRRHCGGGGRDRRAGQRARADIAREADVLALRDEVLARRSGSTCWSTTPASTRSSAASTDQPGRLAEHHRHQPHWYVPVLQAPGWAMVGAGAGSIINISSVAGHVGCCARCRTARRRAGWRC